MPLHMRLPKLRGPLAKTAMPIGPFRTYMTPGQPVASRRCSPPARWCRPKTLLERGIIKKLDERVKILAIGRTRPSLSPSRLTASARPRVVKIEAAGGTAEVI